MEVMELSAMMSQQLASLQQTVSMSILQSQLSTSAAQAVVMLNDMQASQPQVAMHPYAGNIIDLKA